MKFNEFKYERLDLEDIKNEYGSLLNELKECTDVDSFNEVFKRINKYRAHLNTMVQLCYIRHSIDTSDTFYDEEQSYWDNTLPEVQVYETDFFKICLNFKKRSELKIPEVFFKQAEYSLKTFDEKIIEDLQEENRLSSEYGKLKASAKIEFNGEVYNLASIESQFSSSDRNIRQEAYKAYAKFFEDNEDKFDDIYDKLVKVRDRMAKKLGYESFIELGYLRMNRFDYDKEMVSNYRKQVVDVIVPIATEIYEKQAKRIGVDRLEAYDVNYKFRSGNPKPVGDEKTLVNKALKMYEEMSKETAEFFNVMVENDLFDLTTKPHKQMGGYCTELLDYKVPFIFSNFNGESGDVNVLTHEAGHALQSYLSLKEIDIPDLTFPSMESCEIHSMSMEFFAFPYLNDFFGKDGDKYAYEELSGALTFLPYGCLVDHFQHEVYANPELSPKERKELWRRLEKMYKPHLSYDDIAVFERGAFFFKQGHIFENPFYYIDYTLAQVCALQFYKRFVDKDENYFNDYLQICRLGGTKTFVGLVREAGLKSPFEDGCLSSIAGTIKEEMEKYESLLVEE
ncbi:MAG: M3 family oligoendopeptidase [Erysipelotrichaceae bacterium]|nr:M3 family oligoendopeptidase [Erysipelotrichaceae bacterium]